MEDAPKPEGEPEWNVSALDVAIAEEQIDAFQPVGGDYSGLRQRKPLEAHHIPAGAKPSQLRRALDMRLWSPHATLLASFAIGILILILSVRRGVAFLQVTIHPVTGMLSRDVGFAWSPYWSAGVLFLIPFALYLMVSILRWLPDIVEEMGERGMLSTENYQIGVHGSEITKGWLNIDWKEDWATLVVLVGGALAIMGITLSAGGEPTGALAPSWRRDTFFFHLVRTWQALVAIMLLMFVIYIIRFGRVLRRPIRWVGEARLPAIVVPDLSSSDTRRGFELFEGPLEQLLMLGAIAFIAANLARIDAAYLAATTGATVWLFVYDTLALGIVKPDNAAALARLIKELALDMRTIGMSVGAAFFFLVSYFGLAGAVQDAAIRASRNAREYFRKFPNESFSGYPPKDEREALMSMQKRPILFPPPYLLLSLFGIGLLSILFYQVGVYLFGITLVVMFGTVIVRLIRRK